MEEEIHVKEWWDNITESEFQAMFRMSSNCFVEFQAEVYTANEIDSCGTDRNLLACLWILGNTAPISEAIELFMLDDYVNTIIKTLQQIIKLAMVYMAWPSLEEAELIEGSFIKEYKLPSIIGVVGSVHISVNVDDMQNKMLYFNPDIQKHTIVIQLVCDNNLVLRDVCVGCPGGKSVSQILKDSPLYYEKLVDKDSYLVTNNKVLFGGTNHLQLKTLLTPYTCENLTDNQLLFNDKHNSIMGLINKTVVHLENRFPRFASVDDLNPKLAGYLLGACCVLHNFTKINDNWNFDE